MILKGTYEYEVGRKVAQNDRFSIYLCTPKDDPKKSLLLVAAQAGKNAIVDRWAFILGQLAQTAQRLEKGYAAIKSDPNDFLNYQLAFPKVLEAFKSPDQQQLMIVAFENSEPSEMVPVARMIQKDCLRVDLKTSVWMLGKSLKNLAFAHCQRISVGPINTGTILIDPEQHYVNFFDWSGATISNSQLSDDVKRKEIVDAALVVIDALEGDASNRTIPHDEGDEEERYCAHLWTLVDGLFCDASKAHKAFYQLVDKLWIPKFHPFTTFGRKVD